MVGPTMSDEERISANARLRIGFVVLVGISAGLVSLQVDPTPLQVAGSVAAGLLVGWLLVRWLVRSYRKSNL
ncbi:hypothetical protein ACFO0N_14825 [Halobium salinum]|uniref:PEP-CTERM protein-sorting domain-containing protein n=1 Tax=Halobium salinum TaxID=1364940 RepID=A0ABD5PEY5_9EURY|nr:hypothetical protein [Halobium salinum]